MVQANPEQSVEDRAAQPLVARYDEFELLETGDVDVFVFNLNEWPHSPPYFIEVAGRRFGLERETFLVRGHGATLPRWLREQEAAGRLVLLAERGTRFLVYVHDPSAEDDEDGDDE